MTHLQKLTIFGHYAKRLGRSRITLRFKPGVTLLVGPNGSGKSTVIECLRREVLAKVKTNEWGDRAKDQKRYASWDVVGETPLPPFYFDFEKDNPRVGGSDGTMSLADIRRMQMRWKYAGRSHGQFTKDVLAELESKLISKKGLAFVLIDEPEQALDLEGMRGLHSILRRTDLAQAIVATHHPFLIAEPAFNCVEMRAGYRNEVVDSILKAADFWRNRCRDQ